jgi:addiction module HigA family antidote
MRIENLSAIVHPGRILLEEFLAPRAISVSRLAEDLDISARRLYELVQGQRSINADLAHRLAHYFGMSERYWLDLQARYDREQAQEKSAMFRPKRSFYAAG